MKTLRWLLTGGVALLATLLFAQTLPPTTAPKPSLRYVGPDMASRPGKNQAIRIFVVDGQAYFCRLTQSDAPGTYSWDPASPLALSLAKAEEIGRAELRKIIRDDVLWTVEDFGISRFPKSPDWHYVVTLKPVVETTRTNTTSFTVLIGLDGNPGQIEQLARRGPQ